MSNNYRTKISYSELLARLRYEKSTGFFYWRKHRRGDLIGARADTAKGDGRWVISINGRSFYAHRVAWFYVKGVWPEFTIDHRNGNPGCNIWRNLRPATRMQNSSNMGAHFDNKCGVVGVCWYKRNKKWRAYVTRNGAQRHGYFDSFEEAVKVRRVWALELHGPFASELRE